MSKEVKIPSVGESVASGVISRWHKAAGDFIRAGEVLLTLETDKVSTEIASDADGILEILAAEGSEVQVGQIVARIAVSNESEQHGTDSTQPKNQESVHSSEQAVAAEQTSASDSEPAPEYAIAPEPDSAIESASPEGTTSQQTEERDEIDRHGPSAARVMRQEQIEPAEVKERSGLGGRITRDDLEEFLKRRAQQVGSQQAPAASREEASPATGKPETHDSVTPAQPVEREASAQSPPASSTQLAAPTPAPTLAVASLPADAEAMTTRKPMSPLRKKIAQQLVNAQRQAALLTTFNECDMTAVMAIRSRMQESFQARHGIKLGFMSFFVKAVVNALQEVPAINARLDGDDIVQHHYYDIGVAVGTDRGLVVPVLRRADTKSFAALEKEMSAYAAKARDGKIQIDDLRGGIFTITNGGIYGSLFSTPIVNPPQSAILGMHGIKERPVASNGEITIRPMMYLALTYDHRLIDGKEAVTFLARVKEAIEDPMQLIL